MNDIIKHLLSNNLENLDEFKISGEIVVNKDLVVEALKSQFEEVMKPKTKKKGEKSAKQKIAEMDIDVDKNDLGSILENIHVNNFNLKTDSDKVAIEFDIAK